MIPLRGIRCAAAAVARARHDDQPFLGSVSGLGDGPDRLRYSRSTAGAIAMTPLPPPSGPEAQVRIEIDAAFKSRPLIPDDEAAMIAIRKISFGQHRADRGYDDFAVEFVGDPVPTDLGGDLGVRTVPANIHVKAEKWKT